VKQENPIEKKARSFYRMARYSSIGLELGVSVVIGLLIGWWIDIKFDCGPWGLLGGLGVGFAAAIRSIARTLNELAEEEAAEEARKNDGRSES